MLQKLGKTGLAVARIWHLVDAKGKTLDTLATRISIALCGKYKPTYSPKNDVGDYVVVINARQVVPEEELIYKWHTGWPGGKRELLFQDMVKRHPTLPILKAVYSKLSRCLSKEKDKRMIMERLKIFPGAEYPFEENIFKDYTGGKMPEKISLADLEDQHDKTLK